MIARLQKLSLFVALLSLAACGSLGTKDEPQPPPDTPVDVLPQHALPRILYNEPVVGAGGGELVWSEEFDAAELHADVWLAESGIGRAEDNPGGAEERLQWYSPDNVEVRDGRLILTVLDKAQNGKPYTSARVTTADRFAFRYGRIEARIRLPAGQGIWPAFWLLPQQPRYGSWPASGEIDVLQAANLGGSGDNDIFSTLHFGGEYPESVYNGLKLSVPTDVTDEFHTYVLEWDRKMMRWYVNDFEYGRLTSWFTPGAAYPAPFDQPFYLVLNIGVGGDLPGPPDTSTVLPVSMEVDYIRIFSGKP